MFAYASMFNQSLNDWCTYNVEYKIDMFSNAISFTNNEL